MAQHFTFSPFLYINDVHWETQTPFVNGSTENYSSLCGAHVQGPLEKWRHERLARIFSCQWTWDLNPQPKSHQWYGRPAPTRERKTRPCTQLLLLGFSAHACGPLPSACVEPFSIFNRQSMNLPRQSSVSANKTICSIKNWSSTNINLQSCSGSALNLILNFTWTSCSLTCSQSDPCQPNGLSG